jgi:hypothetical protein
MIDQNTISRRINFWECPAKYIDNTILSNEDVIIAVSDLRFDGSQETDINWIHDNGILKLRLAFHGIWSD